MAVIIKSRQGDIGTGEITLLEQERLPCRFPERVGETSPKTSPPCSAEDNLLLAVEEIMSQAHAALTIATSMRGIAEVEELSMTLHLSTLSRLPTLTTRTRKASS